MLKELNTNVEDMLRALENDDDFRLLKRKYESPNCFTIMGDKRREEWHSSFVCWLLDPKQNHKLSSFPIEKFLELVESKKADLKIDKTDIADIKFDTEHYIDSKRRIDIFGKSRSLLLVIENKIKSEEHNLQSNDYYEYGEKNYKDKQRCYILLKAYPTTELDNENFIPITYQELFDYVIKPALEKSQELKLEDTHRVLEQYSLDISNPFTVSSFVNAQKDISEKIYRKHTEILELICDTMRNDDKDEESQICKFFTTNYAYINDIILKSLKKNIIEKNLRGVPLLKELLVRGFIIPDKTELTYKRNTATIIIMVDENGEFYSGYCWGDYSGQDVEVFDIGFESLHKAQIAVEEEVHRLKTGSDEPLVNAGKNVNYLKLINSGIPEAEGMLIQEIQKKFL